MSSFNTSALMACFYKIQDNFKMSLNHKFFLLNHQDKLHFDYNSYLSIESEVKIHDDLLRYINDTLNWIPSLNPTRPGNSQEFGLNFYGVTIIDQIGTQSLSKILAAWIDLFSNSPSVLNLKGSWTTEIDDNDVEGDGYYETLTFNRDGIIDSLKALKQYAELVNDVNSFILHIGI